MDFKDKLLQQGLKLMNDPRVVKLMEDERVTKAAIAAMQMPDRVKKEVDAGMAWATDRLNIATRDEVTQLEGTIAELRRELKAAKTNGQE